MARVLSSLLILSILAAGCAQQRETLREPAAQAAAQALLSREVLFGNPDRARVQLSPDGRYLSWLAPLEGVLNVWVAPVEDLAAAKAVTRDAKRGIRMYVWAYDGRTLLYPQDEAGDENWRVNAVDVVAGGEKDLTPLAGVQARIAGVSRQVPQTVLIALNDRVPELHDVWAVDLASGKRQRILENPGFAAFVTDEQLRVRMGLVQTAEGGARLLRALDPVGPDGKPASAASPRAAKGARGKAGPQAEARKAAGLTPPASEAPAFPGWEVVAEIPQADELTTQPLFFDAAGATLYMMDSRGRNTAALTAMDPESGETRELAAHPKADASDFLVHPTQLTPQAVAFEYERKTWKVLDEAVAGDLDYLRGVADGDAEVLSRTDDDAFWIVGYVMDDGPVRYYRYDRAARKASFLFTNRKELEGVALASMHPLVIPARDALSLVSYLTLPRESDPDGDARPDRPLPMVLLVHGGPWGRDSWGLNSMHQWLADRGYAVLSVNFRGSTGFGKDFTNAGDLEWGRKMHDDLVDAVAWSVNQKISAPDKVAIMGGSYGGYATLAGLTFTPERFACGVDIVGPSNLVTLLESIPPYWKPLLESFASRVGDPRTEAGRALLEERSPLNHVSAIKRPLLIGQGANDPRVKQAESDQIVEAMQEKGIPVTYVLFPDEGHGFARPENRLAFFAVAESFLSGCLGGRFETVGDDFEGSSIQIPAGKDVVPGLAAAP